MGTRKPYSVKSAFRKATRLNCNTAKAPMRQQRTAVPVLPNHDFCAEDFKILRRTGK